MVTLKDENEIISRWKNYNGEPLVSIICVTYNQEKYIEDAIKGFLRQITDFSFEIIIHDDASTDKTAEIIRNYSKKYPRIIKPIYQEENQFSSGVNIIAKFTFQKAKGQYIALCDGDDFWVDENKIQTQISFLETNPDYVITYTAVKAISDDTYIDSYFGGALCDLSQDELKKGTPINTLTTCFRNVISDFPPELHFGKVGDIILWSLLGSYGKGKYLNNIKPSIYRIHEAGIFSKKNFSHQLDMLFTTHISLYLHFTQIQDQKTSDYFLYRSIKFLFIKNGVIKIIRLSIFYLFKSLKKKCLLFFQN